MDGSMQVSTECEDICITYSCSSMAGLLGHGRCVDWVQGRVPLDPLRIPLGCPLVFPCPISLVDEQTQLPWPGWAC